MRFVSDVELERLNEDLWHEIEGKARQDRKRVSRRLGGVILLLFAVLFYGALGWLWLAK